MQIARIPKFAEWVFPQALYRIPHKNRKVVYLTFDDGPVPEATPLVLDVLKRYNVKATFFCVGENVKKHPDLHKRVIEEGHSVGNHTFNHLDGWRQPMEQYMENVEKCSEYVNSVLFRPPYGRMTRKLYKELHKNHTIVMWDVLTCDYDKALTAENCLEFVKKLTRPGSIIVFHDSVKALEKLPLLLPKTLDYLASEGYQPETIMDTR